MPSIFSRIIVGEIPSYKIAEDDRFFAFLDINPIAKGHTLVVPKQEVDYFFDLEEQLLGDLMIFSKRVALAIESVVSCERIGLTVLGLEVPHAHVHLVPLDGRGTISFKHKISMEQNEMIQLAKDISNSFR